MLSINPLMKKLLSTMHVIKATVGRYCESLSHHFDKDKNSIKKCMSPSFPREKSVTLGSLEVFQLHTDMSQAGNPGTSVSQQ